MQLHILRAIAHLTEHFLGTFAKRAMRGPQVLPLLHLLERRALLRCILLLDLVLDERVNLLDLLADARLAILVAADLVSL